MYGGKMDFNRKPQKVDAFVVRVSELGDVLNLEELKAWINNKGYFQWLVYTNSEGGKLFKVYNAFEKQFEYRPLADMDVLFFTLNEIGVREQSYPNWDFEGRFNGTYERTCDA